jgi:toxin-antitoxin system PIN domain toxin
VILVDANILLYAEDSSSPFHDKARPWWDEQLSGALPVCLCWQVIDAFVRIGTNSRVFEHPLLVAQAISRVGSWLEQPCIRLIQPTDHHWIVFQEMLTAGQASGNLVPDAHLAALALEHGCTLYSSDADFSRFPRLKWKNPLSKD